MWLLDKIKDPVFVKQGSTAQALLDGLQNLRAQAQGSLAQELDDEIRRVELGMLGEKSVQFELENSHIPMCVLHDLYLEHDGLSAQIDYLLITRGCVFVLECKNLYGDIEINANGDFIRTVQYARRTKKEGIYSPITQNRRHLDLIRAIRSQEKTNLVSRALFDHSFADCYRSVVVLANPKTVLYDRYAKKEVKSQVIRADHLAEYIRQVNALPQSPAFSESTMQEMARYFLALDRPQTTDRLEKYRAALEQQKAEAEAAEKPAAPAPAAAAPAPQTEVLCPRCGAPMVRRVAAKGPNAGKAFYGCSRFPHCRGIVSLKEE